MSQASIDGSFSRRDHDPEKNDYPESLSPDATNHNELQLRVGWLERRQVLHTNLRNGDWKLATTAYLLLLIIAAPFI